MKGKLPKQEKAQSQKHTNISETLRGLVYTEKAFPDRNYEIKGFHK